MISALTQGPRLANSYFRSLFQTRTGKAISLGTVVGLAANTYRMIANVAIESIFGTKSLPQSIKSPFLDTPEVLTNVATHVIAGAGAAALGSMAMRTASLSQRIAIGIPLVGFFWYAPLSVVSTGFCGFLCATLSEGSSPTATATARRGP